MARFISPIRAPLSAPVWDRLCTRVCLGKSRMEGSFSSVRTADTARQSTNPAWCLPGPGCSHRTSCSGS
jgi:hypothetical protein